MFADPQSLTYATVSKVLPATGRGTDSSAYKLNDSGTVYSLALSHGFKPRRTRAVARLQRDAFASDPVVPAQNLLASMTATLTIDFPTVGLTATDAQNLANCLVAWSTPANLLKLLNGET
jgi:hypothetical protein